MKNTSISSGRVSSAKGIRPSARSLTVILAVAGLLVLLPLATSLSKTMLSTPDAPAIAAAITVQSQTSTFSLHGTGPVDNPPTLFLNTTAPTATAEKFKDSASINRNGGNPWKEVGTWPAAATMTSGSLTSLSDLHVWLGLKNSDDQGTYFDLRVEAYKNSTLVAAGQSLCITGVTRNATAAKEVVLGFDPFSPTSFNGTSDLLKLKVLTRVGSTAAGASCGGHNNAVGLRLYFDAVARASRFNATKGNSDTTPPVLTVTQPADNSITTATQISVSGTFSDQSPTIITVNGVTATLQGNTFSAAVSLVEGSNPLQVVATDSAGNQSQVTRTVKRDTTAPVIVVTPEKTITNATQVAVTVKLTEASPATVTVNGSAATPAGNEYVANVALGDGVNQIQVTATDVVGNQATASVFVTRDSIAPVLNVISPTDNFVTNSTAVDIFGEASDATPVSVTVNDEPVILNSPIFSGRINLTDGVHQLRVRATDAAGNQTEVVRTVTADETQPVITDLMPAAGTLIVGTSTTVQGRVTDATTVIVKVGAVTATVNSGGLFTALNVPVAEGENELKITATDVAGNESEAELSLTGKDVTPPASPLLFAVSSPTRLTFQSIEGRAEPGTLIRITGGAGPAETSAAFGSGLFIANVQLASGTNALSLTATDATGNVSSTVGLSITSDPNLSFPPDGQASSITVATGDAQRGLVDAGLPRPLIAIVRDRSGHRIASTTVRFTVTHGGGRFTNGSTTADVQSDTDGYASASYISGPAPGIQLIRADFAGDILSPTTFMAEAFAAQPGGATSMSGTVLDMNLRALPNVLVRIGGQQARTGANGRFRIENVSAGPHQILELIGRDQIPLPGRWPNISYDIDVLPGIDNNMGRQLFLPKVNDGIALPLDANNVVTQDTSVQLPVVGGEPPIVVTAHAGTHVTFPPDVTDKRLSVTRIPANRVPMPLEDGLATNLFISVQPSGAIFDQPLEVSFPNLDGSLPNSEVLLMSFDHDAGRYVRVGTGRVSADGRTVTTDPGGGIRVGAWHAAPRPPGGGGNPPNSDYTVTGDIQIEGNPDLELVHIDDILVSAGGNRGIVLTDRSQWHHVPVLTARVRGTAPGGSPPPPVFLDAQVQKTTPEFTLEEVSFEDNYALKSDDGQTEYKKPHWKKPASPDPAFKGSPVAYKVEAGKKMKLSARFSIATEVTDGKALRVKADGNDAYDLDAATAELKKDGGSTFVVLKATSVKTAFATDTIDYFDSMDFKWEVSRDAGANWSEAGTSSNQLYVTLGKPGQAFLTTVHLATVNLKGKTKSQMQTIVDTIWAEFSGRAVYRASDTNQQTKLKYWGTICNGTTDPTLCFEPKGLMVQADARCEGWSEFFFDVLRTQAVSVTKIWIQGKPKSNLGTGQFYVSGIDVVNNPSQGDHVTAPPTRFNGHAIVRVKVNNVEKLYDPSYGTGPFANLIAWEDASLIAVIYRETKDSPIIPSLTEPNKPGSEETVLVVQ